MNEAGFAGYDRLRERMLRRADLIDSVWARARSAGGEAVALLDGVDDESDDPVVAALADARARLTSSTVDIGVFGDVNRGKSTLLNALLGIEASSMRVTPETAVPVWVVSGDGEAEVMFADGTSRVFDDPADAREYASQRMKRGRDAKAAPILRVVQRLRCTWPGPGVRLIDTPGLDDPSLAEEFEALTLAELDRVAAAVMVISVPPGVAANEAHLLQGLASHRIDKLFVACNFHSEQWEDQSVRADVREHIESVLGAVLDHDLASDLQLFEVNAKRGLVASLARDEEGLEESGVGALRVALESYLSNDVLRRLGRTIQLRLGDATALARVQLERRRELLRNPQHLDQLRDDHRRRVEVSHRDLEQVIGAARTSASDAGKALMRVVIKPFDLALDKLSSATSVHDIDDLQERLRLNVETAASQAAKTLADHASVIEEEMQAALSRAFGATGDVVRGDAANHLRSLPTGITLPARLTSTDGGAIAAGAGVGGLGAGLVGGSLAGGVGVAMLALGPVGWLIGAGIGLLAGGLIGGGATALLTKGRVSDEAKAKVRAALTDARSEASRAAEMSATDLANAYGHELRRQADHFFGTEQRDLERVERVRSDVKRLQRDLDEVERLLGELNAIR